MHYTHEKTYAKLESSVLHIENEAGNAISTPATINYD